MCPPSYVTLGSEDFSTRNRGIAALNVLMREGRMGDLIGDECMRHISA